METKKAACSKHRVVHTVETRAKGKVKTRESKHIYKCKRGMGMGGPSRVAGKANNREMKTNQTSAHWLLTTAWGGKGRPKERQERKRREDLIET